MSDWISEETSWYLSVFEVLAVVKLKAFLPFVSQTAKDEHKNLLGGSGERLLFILFLLWNISIRDYLPTLSNITVWNISLHSGSAIKEEDQQHVLILKNTYNNQMVLLQVTWTISYPHHDYTIPDWPQVKTAEIHMFSPQCDVNI